MANEPNIDTIRNVVRVYEEVKWISFESNCSFGILIPFSFLFYSFRERGSWRFRPNRLGARIVRAWEPWAAAANKWEESQSFRDGKNERKKKQVAVVYRVELYSSQTRSAQRSRSHSFLLYSPG